MDGESYQITKNRINLELIEIFQFYVKIYDLCHPHTYQPTHPVELGMLYPDSGISMDVENF